MADRSAGGAAAAVTASPDARVGPGPDAWGDRISGRVTRGRVPGGVVYVAAWLVVFTVLTASQWAAGSYPVGTIVPLHAVLAAGVSFPIWLIGIFNRSAEEAMRRVRPLLAMSDAEATRLTERLTRMPARLEAAFAGFWIALTVLRVTLSPGSTVSLNLVFEGPAGVVGAAVMVVYIASVASYVVKIGHLGLGVYRLSQREVAVSLFELGPLNGFAVLTARIAASLVVMAVAIYASRQTLLTDPIGITAGLLALGFSGAIFVLPLLGIHERLAAEKGRLLGDAVQALERAIRDLHAAIETQDLASMDARTKAIAAVEAEMRILAAIPTWPWMPDTFRWVIGALMFPLVLFLIQFVITKVLTA